MVAEKITSKRRLTLENLLFHFRGHAVETQRQRILRALQTGSLTTHEARSHLDVLSPAARILELRRHGYAITTIWVTQITGASKPHRIAKYILMPESK